jgi:hypothetical protein
MTNDIQQEILACAKKRARALFAAAAGLLLIVISLLIGSESVTETEYITYVFKHDMWGTVGAGAVIMLVGIGYAVYMHNKIKQLEVENKGNK